MQIQPILGYFWGVISATRPPLLDLGPRFLHILDPPLSQTLCRAGPRGRAREWATLGVHPLSWLLSNNRLEELCGTLTKGTASNRLLLSNQDKGCTPSVVLPLALPLGPALHNLSIMFWGQDLRGYRQKGLQQEATDEGLSYPVYLVEKQECLESPYS